MDGQHDHFRSLVISLNQAICTTGNQTSFFMQHAGVKNLLLVTPLADLSEFLRIGAGGFGRKTIHKMDSMNQC
jgi:hypothetical protein